MTYLLIIDGAGDRTTAIANKRSVLEEYAKVCLFTDLDAVAAYYQEHGDIEYERKARLLRVRAYDMSFAQLQEFEEFIDYMELYELSINPVDAILGGFI